VIALAHNNMEVRLASGSRISYARLEDILCLFGILAMEVDGVLCNAALGVVLAEDVLRSLLVVCVLLFLVTLALIREGFCFCAIAGGVRVVGLGVLV